MSVASFQQSYFSTRESGSRNSLESAAASYNFTIYLVLTQSSGPRLKC